MNNKKNPSKKGALGIRQMRKIIKYAVGLSSSTKF